MPALSTGRVFVVGSANLDRFMHVDAMVAQGETIAASAVSEEVGGKGLNQAVAAARAGAETLMVGGLGGDGSAATIRARCEVEENLDFKFVRTHEGAETGQAFIQVDAGGDNAIVIVAGANALVDEAHIAAALAEAEPGDVVVCQNEIPPAATKAALRIAREQGARTVLNLAPGSSDQSFLGHVDVLIVNESEAALLLGEASSAAAAELNARFGLDTIVTLGDKGAEVAAGEFTGALPAQPTQVVDTTGAGDAFVGAFAASLAQGFELPDAVRVGMAAGSSACTGAGAQGYAQRQADFLAAAGVDRP